LWHEVAVLKQMEHLSLPMVYDFFAENGCDSMAVEYIRGTTLADYIAENGPLRQHQAILLMRKLMSVIKYLHSFNPPIVHCDLKPANIMLKGDGQIKLIDFGTAFMLYGSGHFSRSGTPGFTAPELFNMGNEGHESCDVFSLGAVFYYILTGAVPSDKLSGFKGKQAKKISTGVKKIITCCLEGNPDKRYQNVNQLQDDLKNFRHFEKGQIVKRFFLRIIRLCIPMIFFVAGFYVVNSLSVTAGLSLILAGLYFLILGLGQRNYQVRITKSILLTEKKSVGLWTILLFMMLIFFAVSESEAHAESSQTIIVSRHLPVTIRDNGYKLLIENGSVYRPLKDIIIEIPLGGLPKGKEMSMRVVVEDAGMRYESREFLVWVGD
jgi:serine/threonine protein kinase